MNQQQYDTAKDIILDLLGWGVPPEYLVHCGLSREIVYYVFTELRLRLPADFDATGIPPYTPELLHSVMESKVRSNPGSSISRAHTFPQLPMKPSASPAVETNPTNTPLSAKASPFQPASQPESSPSLHDIEQQRRRELLARKAVMASRKGKQPEVRRTPSPSPSPTASSVNEPTKDIEMAPAETVDDFLNSIGPADDQPQQPFHQPPNTGDTSKASDPPPPSPQRSSTPAAMDVDDIPGLNSESSGAWTSIESAPTLSSIDTGSVLEPEITSPITAESVTPSLLNGNGAATPTSDESAATPRRGTKRPVAADFVDYEGEVLVGHNGYGNAAPPFSRRKLGSFASVSGMRRCVIDVSDSEDDGFEENGFYRSSVHSPHPAPARQPSWLVSATLDAATPPPGGAGGQSAHLLQKEQEIKKMREMIAQREQIRMRKLVVSFSFFYPIRVFTDYFPKMSTQNTPSQSPSPMLTPTNGTYTPILVARRGSQSSSVTSTPAEDELSDQKSASNGVHESEEDDVMNDLLSTCSSPFDFLTYITGLHAPSEFS